MKAVFDASAALAILNQEPGADKARSFLSGASISSVNVVEVGTRLVDGGMPFEAAREAIKLLKLRVSDFDSDLCDRAIQLRGQTRSKGLSLADRSCLALALREGATAITADRIWSGADVGCPIELIR
jgi:PIN domain nuclease of toxin-antitoxin system